MTGLDHYVGHVLDEKYRLERLLGQGGMGAVYLASHLGTERYVALKLITPRLMRDEEFIERFKREARAAGRLRHPNVVDVTDFGFAQAGVEQVAYLVMEYLDGCTLADVLAEERQLPLEWVVDILEQVCSAVHEAHQQGIVHRDLKPDNIWLEPNRLGGYRVKVLDFGIAKLAEHTDLASNAGISATNLSQESTQFKASVITVTPGENSLEKGATDTGKPTAAVRHTQSAENLEAETVMYRSSQQDSVGQNNRSPREEFSALEADATQLFALPSEAAHPIAATAAASFHRDPLVREDDMDDDRTLMLADATRQIAPGAQTTSPARTSQGTELTRIGAIMGTPLYMSPEQCCGKNLDARSDVYSLGVIAYQMLAGEPPFSGDMPTVMREHMEARPQPLRERNKKLRKRATEVVMAALAKDPADRPQTAAAFANSLRAQAEGIGSLYRRAFALYSEYFPKFLRLSLIAHLPVIIITLLMIPVELVSEYTLELGLAAKVATIAALVVLALLQVVAYFVAASVISGMTAVIVTQLSVAPLRPVELRAAFRVLKRRWRPFLRTGIRVTLRIVIGFILLIIPGIIMTIRYSLYAPVVLIEGLEKKAAMRRARELASRSWRTVIIVALLQFLIPLGVSALLGRISFGRSEQGGIHVSKSSLTHQIYQQLSGLVNIFIVPLMSIVPALLYLKMRQIGGETLTSALEQIEEVEAERSQWQQRMRLRLSLHTPRSR
jgi:serine/threonine protein kinase